MKPRKSFIFILVLVLSAAWIFPTTSICEQTTWDCTCGRKGNTGKFCGSCGRSAEDIQLEKKVNDLTQEVDSLTEQLSTALADLEDRNKQVSVLTDSLKDAQNEKDALKTELAEAQEKIAALTADLAAAIDAAENEQFSAAELGLTYAVLSDEGIEITGYTGEAAELKIPKYLDGYKVLSIGNNAFKSLVKLTSVTIPYSVTAIGASAFFGCSGLTSVTIPASVASIGASAFYGCSSLTSIIIPSGATTIGASAFSRCAKLTAVTIPDSVTDIGTYAFSRCSSDLTIYGKEGSAAAVYAKGNGIHFVAQ